MSANAVQAFVSVMGDGLHPERMEFGFGILTKKPEPERYLVPLREAGLLSTVPSGKLREGAEELSVWPAGPYLAAVAMRATADEGLASAVLEAVRGVTTEGGRSCVRDNYQIWRDCAEIIGHLPVSALQDEDIGRVRTWLSSPFDSSLVATEVSKGLIPNLLDAGDELSKRRLCELLAILTEFEVVEDDAGGRALKTLVEEYWLGEILSAHSQRIGEVCGKPAVEILIGRVASLFQDQPLSASWLVRAAVENNPQNLSRHDAKDALIDALRDTATSATSRVADMISEMLTSESEMVFRIGLHVARVRWDAAVDGIADLIRIEWFVGGGRHELYLLIRDRFQDFPPALRTKVLELIRGLPLREGREDDVPARSHHERYWLLAMANSGDGLVAERLVTLNALLGPPPPQDSHEGLLIYFESFHGAGPPPYSPAALRSLAERGSLIETLNAFKPTVDLNGPTVRSLVKALEGAVVESPVTFFEIRADFLKAKPAYQVGFLSGFLTVWEAGRRERTPTLDANAWSELLQFASEVSAGAEINLDDAAAELLQPQATWLPGLIASWIDAGVKDDDYAMDIASLPHAANLLIDLLTRLEPLHDSGEESDAMNAAINAPGGKVIEALLALILHAKRTGQPDELIRQVMQHLSVALENGGIEAVTLLAAAVAQLNYLEPGWVEARFHQLFPLDDDRRLRWGLRGLANARASSRLHSLLKDKNIYTAALKIRSQLGKAWESLLDRMSIAYLLGDENLEEPFWQSLVKLHDYESFRHIVWFMWTQRNDQLTDTQRSRIVDFWEFLEPKVDLALPNAQHLKGNLGLLAWALSADDHRAGGLLAAAAPFVRHVFHDYEFVGELLRVAASQPLVAMSTLEAMVAKGVPAIDYEDAYLDLLRALYEHGLVDKVIAVADELRHIPAIRELYDKIIG
ncbi:hypothetical protein ACQQ2N_06895 [Dokdonella sp. MW10]|uniref:hypothetical protein n=1 Tax=Dokdonella sp. MW10 TaxID=2992926 RepID=UPI003F808814